MDLRIRGRFMLEAGAWMMIADDEILDAVQASFWRRSPMTFWVGCLPA